MATTPARNLDDLYIDFRDAASKGDIDGLRAGVAAGLNINARMRAGRNISDHQNALGVAAEAGQPEAVKFLLEARNPQPHLGEKCDPNHVGLSHTPLMMAIKGGNLECVQLLLPATDNVERRDHNGRNALLMAAHSANAPIVSFLASAAPKLLDGQDGEGQNALMLAAGSQCVEAVTLLIKTAPQLLEARDKHGLTPLMSAAYGDARNPEANAECVRALLPHSDPNALCQYGHSAWFYAAKTRSLSSLALLADKIDPGIILGSHDSASLMLIRESRMDLLPEVEELEVAVALRRDVAIRADHTAKYPPAEPAKPRKKIFGVF